VHLPLAKHNLFASERNRDPDRIIELRTLPRPLPNYGQLPHNWHRRKPVCGLRFQFQRLWLFLQHLRVRRKLSLTIFLFNLGTLSMVIIEGETQGIDRQGIKDFVLQFFFFLGFILIIGVFEKDNDSYAHIGKS
jgi:hypothetical protein